MSERNIYLINGRKVGRYDRGLINCAQILHDGLTGITGMGLDEEEGTLCYGFLVARTEDWRPGPDFTEAYDFAVKQLCLAAIRMYRDRNGISYESTFADPEDWRRETTTVKIKTIPLKEE